MDQVLTVRVERFEQRCREAARRPQAGTCRDIRHAGDLEMRKRRVQELQRLADDRVLHLVG